MALLKFKRSAVPSKAPALGDLELGELAINTYDGKVYMKKDNGTASIVEVGGAGGGGTVTSVAGTGTVNGITLTGTVTSSGSLTLGGTLSGVSLTSQVSGTLPVANGGTGATSLTSGYLVKGNGTSAASASVVYDNGTNVGIGTSSPGSYKLNVQGNVFGSTYSFGANEHLLYQVDASTIGIRIGTTGPYFGIGTTGSDNLRINNASGGNMLFAIAGTERARIDNSGNFSIGNSFGNARLRIVAGANVNAPTLGSAVNYPVFLSNTDGSYGLGIGVNASDGHTWLQGQRADGNAGGIYNITLNEAGGNVGIGTGNPSSLLDVNGNAEVAGTLFLGASNHGNIASDSNTLYLRGTNIAFQNAAGSGTYAYINSSGVLSVGGSNVAIGIQSTGQQVIASSTALTSSGNAGSNILVVTAGITVTLPTSAISGKAITISNISSGSITLSYAGSAGTDGPTTMAAGTSLMLISDGGSPPFWRLTLPFGAFDGSTLFEAGYKILPQNQRTSGYTLAMSDMGKHIFATAGSFTITIPANASVAFPVGAAITIFCGDATKTLGPAGGVTLIQAGTNNTGNRTLAINALVTLVKLQTDVWVVSGAGLS